MRETPVHAELAAGFAEGGSQVRSSVQGLSDEQASRPAIEGWSVKDHLNHLTVWHEMRFHEIGRVARGARPALPLLDDDQVEALNSLTVSFRRGLPLAQVMEDLDFARSLVVEAIAGAPEQALREENFEEVGLRGGIEHDIDHASAIRAWREREGI